MSTVNIIAAVLSVALLISVIVIGFSNSVASF